MDNIEEQALDMKDSVLQNFSRIIDKTKPETTLEEKLALGKQTAITLIAIASIGLILGFFVSLFV